VEHAVAPELAPERVLVLPPLHQCGRLGLAPLLVRALPLALLAAAAAAITATAASPVAAAGLHIVGLVVVVVAVAVGATDDVVFEGERGVARRARAALVARAIGAQPQGVVA
jgi:hypothetical protein